METVQIEILGQKYSIKGVADAAYIRDLARFVDARMREVQRGTGASDLYRVAILAALNIADDLQKMKSHKDSIEKTASQAVSRILDIIDSPDMPNNS